VYDKLDGSLGILYFYDDKPYIATRGSFTSEQAERANKIFQKKYSHLHFNKEHTYLFEIIYPENRIVVDYGAKEDLILLAVLDTETGKDLELPDWKCPK
jgi:RNA ligase